MRASVRLFALLITASSLAACATTPEPAKLAANAGSTQPVVSDLPLPTPDATVLGLYLAGNTAVAQGRTDIAVEYLAKAADMVDESGQGFLKEQAFAAAVMSGRIEQAVVLAPTEGQGSVGNIRLGKLVTAVDAMARGDNAQAYEILKGDNVGPPYRSAAMLLRPWAAAGAGDVAASIATPDATRGDAVTQAFALQNRAMLLERAGKAADAEAAYKALIGQDTHINLFVLSYAAFLERQNRRAEAITLYDRLLAERPEDRPVKAARDRAKARKPAPAMLTPQQGAGMGLLAVATTALSQNQQPVAVAYLRLALRADPQRTEATLLIADWMEGQKNREASRAGYASVPRTAQEYLSARRGLAASYMADEDDAKALQVAQETAKEFPEDLDAQVLLADMMRRTKDFDGAVAVLNKVVEKTGKDTPWKLYFSRAIALEKSGNWPAAEKDLKSAMALAPNEPELQNYLGYTWADRNENLPQALELLKRAARSQPTSGAILDSLGWAYYRSGDLKMALVNLEQAVELEPSDPDINNHLGDVYLKAGRTLEARYQWERVLTLQAEPAMKADANAKLAAHPEETKAVAAVDPVRANP